MKMTPAILVIGGLLVFWASVFTMVFFPAITWKVQPSDTWRPLTAEEEGGLRLYVDNGCSYCHSQYIRIIDWGHGAERIAEAGDYVGREPAILGTERTGPDLSQEAGEHPDDWHRAHFSNSRFTTPISLMPSWEFLGEDRIKKLTAYMQAEGGKDGDMRVARQDKWKKEAVAAYEAGPDENMKWIHSHIPTVWQAMPNPYPATTVDLARGKQLFQQYCVGCHGTIGDGQTAAARYIYPPPLNFTTVRRHLVYNKYLGGIFYYQIMNGITGTGMPYFKKILESEKIWDLSNYVAVSFVGYTDANIAPRGIDAAYEPFWKNTYTPPDIPGDKPVESDDR